MIYVFYIHILFNITNILEVYISLFTFNHFLKTNDNYKINNNNNNIYK